MRVQWVAPAFWASPKQRTRSDLMVGGSGFPASDFTFAMDAARLETLTAVLRATTVAMTFLRCC